MLSDVSSDIVLAPRILGSPRSNMLGPLASLTVIKVTSFRQSSCALLNVTTFLGRDVTVVASAGHVRAVLCCAAWELVGDGLVDSRFVG